MTPIEYKGMMTMTKGRFVFAFVAIIFSTGCGTIFSGSKQNVRLYSTPAGATVKIQSAQGDYYRQMTTPCEASLPRKYNYRLEFSKDGHDQVNRLLDRKFNPICALSIIYYIIPYFVDLATGSAWKLVPDSVDVYLAEKKELTIPSPSHKPPEPRPQPNSPMPRDEPNPAVAWLRAESTFVLSAGVGRFKDDTIPPLTCAESDARTFSKFCNQAGIPENNIKTIVAEECGRSEFLARLSEMRRKMTNPSDVGVIYFSGHGAPVLEQGRVKDAVLLSYDSREVALEDTGIKLSELQRKLGESNGKWIIVLDACFSGKAGRGIIPAGTKGLIVMPDRVPGFESQAGNVFLLAASSGDGYSNESPENSGGLFTVYLMQAMKGAPGVDGDQDGLISVREVFAWTDAKVRDVSARSLSRPQYPELLAPDKKDIIFIMPK